MAPKCFVEARTSPHSPYRRNLCLHLSGWKNVHLTSWWVKTVRPGRRCQLQVQLLFGWWHAVEAMLCPCRETLGCHRCPGQPLWLRCVGGGGQVMWTLLIHAFDKHVCLVHFCSTKNLMFVLVDVDPLMRLSLATCLTGAHQSLSLTVFS